MPLRYVRDKYVLITCKTNGPKFFSKTDRPRVYGKVNLKQINKYSTHCIPWQHQFPDIGAKVIADFTTRSHVVQANANEANVRVNKFNWLMTLKVLRECRGTKGNALNVGLTY